MEKENKEISIEEIDNFNEKIASETSELISDIRTCLIN